ncbi:MAG: UbiX family flavin prenyltransferase [Desulfarculaceae bacterium]|nr:UbiX family flavin prenyltransferase [Desulfarculaceae bacterium]MCF8072041.1 UbiX family flavin prenyltransferase [Desulfarculaceae bacterium]MCF8101558.1 UbiX family flavin prenyltransferase [Desulfarculaceae bacterium]MCF8115108.1 UbiX family flavin prenyltransferase [Desulfarculaceae bacterium]
MLLGISGASGVIYGVETLKALSGLGQPCHLILSEAGARNLAIETDYEVDQVKAMAERVYEVDNLAAPPASGSFRHRGMLVAPCTIKTLSAIANSFSHNLLVRAADVCLKERRPLVLMVRETPLHQGHLELMSKAAGLGACILPPIPAFYHQPQSIMDLIHQSIGKALDMLGVEHDLYQRWGGR